MLVNLFFIACSLFTIAIGFTCFQDSASIIVLLALFVFYLTYALGPGPLFYILAAEIFQDKRDKAMPIANFFLWSFNLFTVASWDSLNQSLGDGGVFFLYGGLSTACFLFILFLVQETSPHVQKKVSEF